MMIRVFCFQAEGGKRRWGGVRGVGDGDKGQGMVGYFGKPLERGEGKWERVKRNKKR